MIIQFDSQGTSRCFLHCQHQKRTVTQITTSPSHTITVYSPHTHHSPPPTHNTHPLPPHTNHHHYYTHTEQQSQGPYRVISYSCWRFSFTKVTQLAQARSPQLACKGSSKTSQQNTHRKLWCPERRHGGGNRLALKNSVLSANSVMTEQVSSAVTARGGRHHDRCGSNGHQRL